MIKELNKEQLYELVQEYIKYGKGVTLEEYANNAYKKCEVCGKIVPVDYGSELEEVECWRGYVKGCPDCVETIKKDNEVSKDE